MTKTRKELSKKRSKYRLDGKIRSFCHGRNIISQARQREGDLVRGVKSYTACMHDLMDAWIESGDGAEATEIYRSFIRPTRPNVILAVIDCKASEARSFSVTFVRRCTLATSVLDLPALQMPFDFGSFPDQEYLKNFGLPALNDALTQKRPSLSRGFTIFSGSKIFYECILLPQKSIIGRSEWCILLAKIDLMLPEVFSFNVDDTDLSVLQLLTEGAAQKEIGNALELSPRTIEHRVERLKIRMGAKNLQHLSALWISSRLQDGI